MPSSAIAEYRKRIKTSRCRGLSRKGCSRRKTCKYAYKGKSRKFCRKRKNTRRAKAKYYSANSSSGSAKYGTPKSN
jgi:hypothetical protein